MSGKAVKVGTLIQNSHVPPDVVRKILAEYYATIKVDETAWDVEKTTTLANACGISRKELNWIVMRYRMLGGTENHLDLPDNTVLTKFPNEYYVAERLLKDGMSISEVSKRIGVHKTTVSRWLREMSESGEGLRDIRKKLPLMRETPDICRSIYQLRGSGLRWSELAKHFNLSMYRVKRCFDYGKLIAEGKTESGLIEGGVDL